MLTTLSLYNVLNFQATEQDRTDHAGNLSWARLVMSKALRRMEKDALFSANAAAKESLGNCLGKA